MTKCFEPHPVVGAQCVRNELHDGPHKTELKWEQIKPQRPEGDVFYQFALDNHFKWCTCQHTMKVHRKEQRCRVGNCQCEKFQQMTVDQFLRWRTMSRTIS